VFNTLGAGVRLELNISNQVVFNGKVILDFDANNNPVFGAPSVSPTSAVIAGLNGETALWDGLPANDPFPTLLDKNVWNATRIEYPAATVGMGDSINYGINKTIAGINALPPGTPFAIGGYSQGAAVMSGVYNELRYGVLTSRYSSFLGGVCFGNPRRQRNYRGDPAIVGTWSGTWAATQSNGYRLYRDPTANTTGGAGSFPSNGSWARLINCDQNNWLEFTAPNEIISANGTSSVEQNWESGNGILLNVAPIRYLGQFLYGLVSSLVQLGINQTMFNDIKTAFAAPINNYLIDAIGNSFKLEGGGHVIYPLLPPVASNGVVPANVVNVDGVNHLSANADTCYQVALKWLEGKAQASATAPIALSTNTTGWSTRLLPPS